MTSTLCQQRTPHLRIGPWSIVIPTATKGRRVRAGICRVEERPVDGHETVATKEGAGHLLRLRNESTPCLHECLQARAPQCLASSAQPRIAQIALRLAWMQRAELSYQFLPHQALAQTTPQRHPDHKPHQGQHRTLAHPSGFARPRLTLPHTPLDLFFGIHLSQQCQIHLFTHLVIDIHLA
jgi:hypothetical protein